MKKISSLTIMLTLISSFAASLNAQQTPIQQNRSGDEDVVRITTNLVQVDAVVTDKNGKQVTNLQADDFEILEDGHPQKITNFSYVSNEVAPAASTPNAPHAPVIKNAPPVPPIALRPGEVHRAMALVVDDLTMSFESIYYVRRALRKYVDEQMQQGDLVAIVRTSAGVGALQQFTSDRRLLYAAIERVKFTGNGGVSPFAALAGDPLVNARSGIDPEGSMGRAGLNNSLSASAAEDELNDFREELFAVGTLGALNYVVRGMRELPGRKSVVLFSEGFQLYTPERSEGRGRGDRVLRALHALTDLANRASVVVYTIDARGLQYVGLTAADDTSGLSPQQVQDQLSQRSQKLFDTQGGLIFLAQQTGGFSIRNTNDLSGGVRRVIEDQKGYYLIGYRPQGATFDRRYHRISANVKRPGLKLRTRTGFYGVADENLHSAPRTREQQLFAALTSPFASGDVHLRLTSLFANNAQVGSYVRSMMFIDPHDLKFNATPDGKEKTIFDVIGVT